MVQSRAWPCEVQAIAHARKVHDASTTEISKHFGGGVALPHGGPVTFAYDILAARVSEMP